jgi:hypothetical protein
VVRRIETDLDAVAERIADRIMLRLYGCTNSARGIRSG